MTNVSDTKTSKAWSTKPANRPRPDPAGNDDQKFARGVERSIARSKRDWVEIEGRKGDQRARVDAARMAAAGVVFGRK